MNIVRRKIPGSKKRYCFDIDKEILIITEKSLINKYQIKDSYIDKNKKTDIPLSLKVYSSEKKYSVLLFKEKGLPEFVFNPKKIRLIELDKKLVEFVTKNYDKI